LYNLNEAYPQKFFARRKSLEWRVPIFVDAIEQIYHPRTLIDFGCGDGDLVRGFNSIGVNAFGVEGTGNCLPYIKLAVAKIHDPENPPVLGIQNRIMIHDLRKPIVKLFEYDDLNLNSGVDLALCLEVAEHIEEEYTDVLIRNITQASDKIAFTAAPPGQEGNHHVNLKSREWWIGKFGGYSYLFDYDSTSAVRYLLERSGKAMVKGIKAWYQNLMCFRSI